MSHGDSHARDSRTRQVAAIFRTLHHYDEGFFVYIPYTLHPTPYTSSWQLPNIILLGEREQTKKRVRFETLFL